MRTGKFKNLRIVRAKDGDWRDFFNMPLNPDATLYITKSEPYNGN
jgi:hypothetical protein